MKRTCACVAWIGLLQTCGVSAQDAGVYVSAAVGRINAPDNSQLNTTQVLTGPADDEDVSWNIGVGYRFNSNIALDVGYVDLGETKADLTDASGATDASGQASFAAEGVTLALVGTFPIGRWEPYIKAGVLFSSTDFRFSGDTESGSFARRITADNEGPFYGTGVRFTVTEPLQIYLDVTFLDEVGEPESGQSSYFNTSAGALWRF
jgi:OmpA-OmpF porin, OOP family